MKLKITDVMICEWDADTKCIIVSPAEGWKVNVNYPISEAHASLVTMEKMDGDYSRLANKWLRSVDTDEAHTKDKWYKVQRVDDNRVYICGDDGDIYGWTNPQYQFDLNNARDYNPDERKPHQLKEYDAVECTPEERAEIIMIADECGVRVFAPTEPLEGQTSLLFFRGVISGTSIRSICDDAGIKRDWHTVPDFISKIRGEYTAVNVTEHKHESV